MRIIFDFQPSPNQPPLDWREHVPAGFTIRRMNAEIAQRVEADLLAAGHPPWFDRVWNGIPTFLEKGVGFVAECQEEDGPFLASNCRAWGIENNIAPIQVSTRARFQGQGLGTLVCAAFIEHCLERGITPEYGCEEDNSRSAALALKLGFVPIGRSDSL